MAAGSMNEVTVAPPPIRTMPRSRFCCSTMLRRTDSYRATMDTARLECLTAEIGELDAVPSAHQELGTEVGLELLEPAGEGGLAHMDLLGGVADRTGIGHRDQRPDEHQLHVCDYCMEHPPYLRFTQSSCPFTVGRVLDDYRTRAAERADLGIPPPSSPHPRSPRSSPASMPGTRDRLPTSSSCSRTGCPPASTMPPQ